GVGLGNRLQKPVGDAFQNEVADDKARHNFDRSGIAIGRHLDGLIEQLAIEKHQRHVTGLIKHPSGRCVGRQDRKVAGSAAAADPPPMDGALKAHLAAIVDTKGRRAEWRKGNIDLARPEARCGHAAPLAWGTGERYLRHGKLVDELQYRVFGAPRFTHRHSHPLHAPRKPRLTRWTADWQTLMEIFPRSR